MFGFEIPLIVYLVLVVVVGVWAGRWNRSGLLWGLLALITSPVVAGLILLIVGNNNPRCPACRMPVDPEATICPYCRSEL